MRILEISYRRSTQPEKYCSEEIAMTASVGDSAPMGVLQDLRNLVHSELGIGVEAPEPAAPEKKEAPKEIKKVEPKKEEPKKEVAAKPAVKKEEPKKKVEPKKETTKAAPKGKTFYKTGGEEGDGYPTHTNVLLEIIGAVCTKERGPDWVKDMPLRGGLSTVSVDLVGTELGKEAKNDLGFTVLPSFKEKATELIMKVIEATPVPEVEV